ncbi:hypothetical protein TNCV_1426301 [Trichonephila clavipes]|nr:hypothetical protein TNCV_1426301 [Trichonephila clavipes]
MSRVLQLFERRCLQLNERVSSTPKKNQSHVAFCSHLRKSCDVEHACLGNVQPQSGVPLQSASPYTISMSAVPPLSTSYYLGKWIANDDYQQD